MYIFSKEKKAIISLKGILKVEKTIGGGKGKKFALTDDLGGVLAFYPEEKNAMDELEKDEYIKNVLGSHVAEKYISAKKEEWYRYSHQVSDWELKAYL